MREISVVILNYNNWEDTIECVDSLMKQTGSEIEIIIVDNDSNNNSLYHIEKRCKDIGNVHVLKSKKNIGYARGNNIGIKYSIEKLNINNVLVVNNDTIFEDPNYILYFCKLRIENEVGAIGTTIIGRDGKNQNPVYTNTSLKKLFKAYIGSFLRYFGIRTSRNRIINTEGQENNMKQFILHGSSIFLTENYLRKANGFYPMTFLFFEENILAIIFNKLGLKMKYTDETYIYHKEDQSTAMAFSNIDKVKIKFELSSVKQAIKVKFSTKKNILKVINRTNDEYELGEL